MYIPKQLMHQVSTGLINIYIYLAGLCNSSLLRSVTGAVIMVFFLRHSVTGAVMISFLLHCWITGSVILSFLTIGVIEKRQGITSDEDYIPQQLFLF